MTKLLIEITNQTQSKASTKSHWFNGILKGTIVMRENAFVMPTMDNRLHHHVLLAMCNQVIRYRAESLTK